MSDVSVTRYYANPTSRKIDKLGKSAINRLTFEFFSCFIKRLKTFVVFMSDSERVELGGHPARMV